MLARCDNFFKTVSGVCLQLSVSQTESMNCMSAFRLLIRVRLVSADLTPMSPVNTSKGVIDSATDHNLTTDRRRSRCAYCGMICGGGRKAQIANSRLCFKPTLGKKQSHVAGRINKKNRRLPHETQYRSCLSLPRHRKCGSRRRKRDDEKLKKREKKSKIPKS